jgi:hypothetical protein
MLKIERIKQNPANWQEMFYSEQPSCREATVLGKASFRLGR